MNKILVIQTASIGDVILATPVIEKLHLYYPEAEISFLIKKGNESLFTNHPFLSEILVWDKRSRKYRNFGRLLRRVRHRRYDLVVNLQRFFLTGLMTLLSGAGIKLGFDKNPLAFLFTEAIPHRIGDGFHEIDRNLALTEAITSPGRVLPKLYPATEDEQAVKHLVSGTFYTISPASLWFTKQFPPEKWAELIRCTGDGHLIYLLGSPADRELCETIVQISGLRRVRNLAGELTFLQSAALMKQARMNFTNDSAPMHLASAVNAPVTAVYCSTIPGFGFGPLSDDSAVVEVPEKLPCRPCGLHGFRTCPEKHFSCALRIPVDLFQHRIYTESL